MTDFSVRSSLSEALRNRPMYEAQCDAREVQYYRARAVGAVPLVAARVAGYDDPAVKSVELEQNPLIKAAIANERACMDAEIHITRHDVITNLMQAAQLAVTAGDAVMAWREIAKIMGYYGPTAEKRKMVTIGPAPVVSQMTEQELKELAAPTIMQEGGFIDMPALESVRVKRE